MLAQEGRPFEEAEKEVYGSAQELLQTRIPKQGRWHRVLQAAYYGWIKEIAKLQLSYVAQRLSQQQIYVEFTDAAIENLAKVGLIQNLELGLFGEQYRKKLRTE